MRRRDVLLGLTLAVRPSIASAQQSQASRRLGVLVGLPEQDKGGQLELAALRAGLNELGWIEGRTIHVQYRWSGASGERIAADARELVDWGPDVLLTRASPSTAAAIAATQKIPIVFVQVAEPVGSGFVQSLSRPGGNVTGFSNFEASIGGKWVELLKEVAPVVRRAGMMFNPQTSPFAEAFARSAEATGATTGMKLVRTPIKHHSEIDGVLASLAGEAGSGLIELPDSYLVEHRMVLIEAAARHAVPAIYSNRTFAPSGGLISYAVDSRDLFRRSASYVDRILNGTTPSDLPVQQPTRFELAI
jgi:putative ABC transport system substrate-binding protein